jgi:hypothetical protein
MVIELHQKQPQLTRWLVPWETAMDGEAKAKDASRKRSRASDYVLALVSSRWASASALQTEIGLPLLRALLSVG